MQCPKCSSQDVIYKEGEKNGKTWRGYFCQEKPGGVKCGGVNWVKFTPPVVAAAKQTLGAQTPRAGSTPILEEILSIVKKTYTAVSGEEIPF